jgi:hypothetical protein
VTKWTQDTPLKTGFHPPEQCARGRTDCRSLHQLISTFGDHTFFCVGEVAPGCSPEPQDKWAFCAKGDGTRDYCAETDVRFFVDQRDLSQIAAVAAAGLAIVIPPDDERGA